MLAVLAACVVLAAPDLTHRTASVREKQPREEEDRPGQESVGGGASHEDVLLALKQDYEELHSSVEARAFFDILVEAVF